MSLLVPFLLHGMVVEDVDCLGKLPGSVSTQEVNFKRSASFLLAMLVAPEFHSLFQFLSTEKHSLCVYLAENL